MQPWEHRAAPEVHSSISATQRGMGQGRAEGVKERGGARGGAEEGRMIDNKASCVSMLECIRMYGLVYK